MNYLNVYNALIENRQKNPISRNDCYCERHHIIPKSEGGSNEPSNLVYLTAREHYICHLLLAKIYNTQGMWAAITMMRSSNKNQYRGVKFNSRLYEFVRMKVSELNRGKHLSDETKMKLSLAHKGKKFSEEHRKKMSLSRKGRKLS